MAEMTIRNIIFDYGNVVINLDFGATYRAFEKLGVEGAEETWGNIAENQLVKQYERGEVGSSEFRKLLADAFSLEVPDAHLDWAWNQLLRDMPSARIELLKKIRNQYRTFLLSNSNEIHYNHYAQELKSVHEIEHFDLLFEKAYFSYQVNLAKPGPDFYQLLLNDHLLNPKETLFIDDLKQNVEAAQKLGLNTIWLKPGMDICDLFDEHQQLNAFAFSCMND